MKKILLTIIGLALASPAWSAQTAVTEISGIQASVGALKTQTNLKLGTVELNRQDHETRVAAMETGKETKAVVQASAPADTTVDWYDTDQETGVLILKRHNGTAWVRAGSHGVQYRSDCSVITGGMCVDTDDGKLYYHNGTTVIEVAAGSGSSYTLPTATVDTLGGIKVGSRLTITGGVLSADVQSGTFDPTADIDFTGNIDFTGATVTGIFPIGTEGDFYRVGASGAETVKPLIPVAGTNITLPVSGDTVTINAVGEDTAYGVGWNGSTKPVSQNAIYDKIESMGSGGATVPPAGIVTSNGTTLSSITPGTGVATAIAAPVDGTGGLASKAALDAISVGSPVTSAPTYSDSACTAGQYAFSTTPPQYWCKATNTWDYQVVSGSALVWAGWSNPTPDTTPNAFTFGTTQTNATLSTQYCSPSVTPTGFNAAATIVSTGTGANKGWKIDGGSFATTGTLSPGSAIQTCHDSSASNSTSTTSSLTIGGIAANDPFAISTVAAAGSDFTVTISTTTASNTGIGNLKLFGQSWTVASGGDGQLKSVTFNSIDSSPTASITCRVGLSTNQLDMSTNYAEGTATWGSSSGEFTIPIVNGPTLNVGEIRTVVCQTDNTSTRSLSYSNSSTYSGGTKFETTARDFNLTGHADTTEDFYFKYTVTR